MDADQGASTPCEQDTDSDTRPLVGSKDRAPMLSRQGPVELGARIMSPLCTPPTDGDGVTDSPAVCLGTAGLPEPAGVRNSGPVPPTAGDVDGVRVLRSDQRTDRTTDRTSLSEQYYGASIEVGHLHTGFGTSNDADGKKVRTKQSRRLPFWIWFVLAKSLGIRVQPGDKPWFGTMMHALTMTFALGFAITHTWYEVYNIVSNETKETVLTGLVSIVLVIYWCSLGIYAHKLAGRLCMSPKFMDSVRLHSKTIFKVSAAGIMVILGVSEVIFNCVVVRNIFDDAYCQKVDLNVEVCKVLYVMRVCCCILTMIWNLLVGIILLSVCRTHTIGLRRFIRELEEDGKVYELYRRNLSLQGPVRPKHDSDSTDDDNLWDEDFSPVEDDGVFPKLLPYHFAQASPCHTPMRKSSRHTSQTSGATAQLPESVSNSNTQVFSTLNSQYFPSNPNYPITTIAGATGYDLHTVEAEVNPTSEQAQAISMAANRTPHKTTPNIEAKVEIENVNDPASSTAATTEGATSECMLEERKHSRPIIIIREGSVATADEPIEPELSEQLVNQKTLIAADPPSFASRSTRSGCDSPHQSTRVELGSPRRVPSSMTGLTGDGSPSEDNLSLGVHMLSTDEILLIYWKLGSRLRSTSLILQRWLSAVLLYIIIWCLTFIVWWVQHQATLSGIVEFVIPILLLPIICSAYGEVNFEGQRMLKCICPTQQRMDMLFFLTQNPLQLTAFGFVINYGLIAGALGALAVALCTRLVLDEMKM